MLEKVLGKDLAARWATVKGGGEANISLAELDRLEVFVGRSTEPGEAGLFWDRAHTRPRSSAGASPHTHTLFLK